MCIKIGCFLLLAPTVASLVVLPPPAALPPSGLGVLVATTTTKTATTGHWNHDRINQLDDGAVAWWWGMYSRTMIIDSEDSTAGNSRSTPGSFSVSSSSTSSSFLLVASSSDEIDNEPSNEDVALLRRAFAEYYARDYTAAVSSFDAVIVKWTKQPVDERAGLYRARADCYMGIGDAQAAYADYDACLKLLNGEGGDAADPSERPTALLGRARAGLAGGAPKTTKAAQQQMADDYKAALLLLGEDEYDDDQTEWEALAAAATKNPYATWEYGAALREVGRPDGTVRNLAAAAFRAIGDPARAAIAAIDAAIDEYAATGDVAAAETSLSTAIAKTVGVEGRDVRLLQRVITKEGEARLALAGLYWSDNQKSQAEEVLGDACVRLDQLANQMDGASTTKPETNTKKLRFSIDDNDDELVGRLTCTRFKNKDFLAKELGWPESLQDKVLQLQLVQPQQQQRR